MHRSNRDLFDHLICTGQDGRRHGEAERLRCLEMTASSNLLGP